MEDIPMSISSPTAQELYQQHRFVDPLPFLKTIDLTQETYPHHRIEMKPAKMKLHSALPDTELWTYEGCFPGPIIEVPKDGNVTIEWVNLLAETIPVQAMTSAEGNPEDPSQNHAGGKPHPAGGDIPQDPYFEKARRLPAWTVVHLHGGRTEPDSDGWTESVIPYGHSKISHYDTSLPPHQHAPTLWFHDHAMGVTRLNVYAGLIGMWLIRDEEDQAILDALRQSHTPHDGHDRPPFEIHLVIADRNLQTENGDPDSPLTGQLLHKTDDGPQRDSSQSWIDRGPMEFFGPFSVVNGAIWPHCTLEPRAYRLRILNASNARTYQLVLASVDVTADGQEQIKPVSSPHVLRQIGSDGGLFRRPVMLPDLRGQLALTLAPAERADLIFDLSSFPDGTNLRWINTAVAPFDGNSTASALGEPDLEARNPFPQVLEFRVRGQQGQQLVLPDPLCDYQSAPPHDQLGNLENRLIVLAEQEDIHDQPPPGVQSDDWKRTTMLTLREMALMGFFKEKPTGYEHSPLPVLTGAPGAGEMDIDFFLDAHSDAQSAVKHHRCRYRTLAAMFHDPINFVPECSDGALPRTDENELGWKDTIRANPGELLKILATFDGFAGRFVYHCHVLEHEDHEMMRPYIVLPEEALDMMPKMPQMPGRHGSH
jgi:spore coat protein A